MNRKQTVVLGLVCLLLAAGSVLVGGDYSGVESFLLAAVYPVLIVGLFLVFTLRDRGATAAKGAERWYLVALAIAIAMWLLTLLVIVA